MTGLGHNSESARELRRRLDAMLRLAAERQKLLEEAKSLNDDIKTGLKACEALGFDKGVCRQILKEMADDGEERQLRFEFEDILDTYRAALGLGRELLRSEAAIERAADALAADGITVEVRSAHGNPVLSRMVAEVEAAIDRKGRKGRSGKELAAEQGGEA